jgi:hypothetical protein
MSTSVTKEVLKKRHPCNTPHKKQLVTAARTTPARDAAQNRHPLQPPATSLSPPAPATKKVIAIAVTFPVIIAWQWKSWHFGWQMLRKMDIRMIFMLICLLLAK